ncbi:MAG: hypothetical protein GY852_10160, partial [bacterium]|nr:hypothetical protein [bacterium]
EIYRFPKILLWISTGTFVFYTYFSYGYVFDLGLGDSQSPSSTIRDPVSYLSFVLRALGSPIVSWDNNLPFGLSIIAFGITVFCFFRFRKASPDTFDRLLPFFAFGLYSLGSLLLTGLGRAALMSARTSRYHVFSMLFWVCFFFIFLTFIERENKVKNHSNKRLLSVCRIGVATTLLFLVSSYARDTYMAVERYRHMLPAQRAVLNLEELEDPDILKRLYPRVEIVRERIIILQDMKLNVFSGSRNTD